MSAPAARAASALSPLAKTKTRAVLPVPCGKLTVERIAWSAFFGSTPRTNATSIDALYLTVDVSLARVTASSGV